MTLDEKEMTSAGPQQRLGDYLEACIHQALTNEADQLLRDGKISRDERIVLSGLIGQSLDVFHAGMPAEVGQRVLSTSPMPQPMAMMRGLSELVSKMEESFKTMFNWGAVEEKATFDDSPWDGSAGQWDTAAAYCSSCLIDTNSSGAEKTKDKCHLPVRKPGSSAINKGALRALASGGRGISALKDVSSADKAKAANFAISHWQAAFGKPAPDSLYRMAGKTPPRAEKSIMMTFKDKAGDTWAVLGYSNRWADRVEDILSQKAHDKFASFVNKSGFHPQMTLFHEPKLPTSFWVKAFQKYQQDIPALNDLLRKVFKDTGWAYAEAEKVVNVNGFSFMIGKVYPDKVELVEKLVAMPDVGSSHAFFIGDFTPRAEKGMIVDEYLTFEGTSLPRARAANPLTMLAVEDKAMADNDVVTKLTDEDRAWLKDLLGADRLAEMESGTAEMSKKLDTLLATKAMAQDDDPEDMMDNGADESTEDASGKKKKKAPAKKETVEEPAPAAAVDVKEVTEAVLKAMNVEQLQTVINGLVQSNKDLTEKFDKALGDLQTKIIQLEKSEDDKIAAKISPINWGQPNFSPASAKETEAVDPDKAKEKVEKEGPHNPAAGEKGDPNNPMNFGFWQLLNQQQPQS